MDKTSDGKTSSFFSPQLITTNMIMIVLAPRDEHDILHENQLELLKMTMTMTLKLASTCDRKKSDAPNFICQQNQISSLGTNKRV